MDTSSRTLKPWAKDLAFFCYLHCGYVPIRDWVLGHLGRSRAVVLYYHRIGSRDRLSKPLEEFRQDLAYLKQRYECLTLAELHCRLSDRTPLKRPVAAVTFDDGYRDNYTHAVPALLEARVPATFFVSTGFVGTQRTFPHDALEGSFPKLTWDDLRAMQVAGFEIGSHTVEHANLGQADEATVRRELSQSLEQLNRQLGPRPRAFSFCWGKPKDMSERAIRAAREIGYYAVASAYGGCNRIGGQTFHLRRTDVGNGNLGRLATQARIEGLDPDYFRLKPPNPNPLHGGLYARI